MEQIGLTPLKNSNENATSRPCLFIAYVLYFPFFSSSFLSPTLNGGAAGKNGLLFAHSGPFFPLFF